MESRVKIAGHAVHPMLIPFPLGLLTTAAIFDLVRLLGAPPELAVAAFWTMTAGLVGGLLAAVFGVIDWLAIPKGTRARRIGLLHGAGNDVVLVLFAVSWLLRLGSEGYAPSGLAVALSLLGAALGGLTAWLGGELVERLGVGVDDGAHLDAPNSLSGRPAAS